MCCICLASSEQEHVLNIYSRAHKYMTSQHKELTRHYKNLKNQYCYLTSDGRNIPLCTNLITLLIINKKKISSKTINCSQALNLGIELLYQ